MNKYIGVKLVTAEPLNLGDYNKERGWTISDDENPEKEGYFIKYPDGYLSWCPKEQFETANRPCEAMPFGHAIEAAKNGEKIARIGWNGKGMFVYVVSARTYPAQIDDAEWEYFGENAMVPYNAYMALKGVDGAVSTWVPSSTDTLADDWCIIE